MNDGIKIPKYSGEKTDWRLWSEVFQARMMSKGLMEALEGNPDDVPTEAIDQMGGWSRRSVGAGYGDGYGLNVLAEYMERITSK